MASPEEAIEWLMAVGNGIEEGGIQALILGQQKALALAIDYSSGSYSRHDIDALYVKDGNKKRRGPYSRAMPHPPEDPAYINVGSGNLLGAWRTEMIATGEDAYFATVHNLSRHAGYLYDEASTAQPDHGTRIQIGRPLPESVIEELEGPFVLLTSDSIRSRMPGGD